jgi:DNA-binding NarL/FixJ family response regulator
MDTPALALIAAPPDSLRYSLQALLAGLPSIDRVQSVEDTRSLLDVLTEIQPRLIVLDVNLLGSETRPLLALIEAIAPRAHTVVLVDTIEQQQALRTTSADVVLLKGYPAAELFASIERLLIQDDPDIDR